MLLLSFIMNPQHRLEFAGELKATLIFGIIVKFMYFILAYFNVFNPSMSEAMKTLELFSEMLKLFFLKCWLSGLLKVLISLLHFLRYCLALMFGNVADYA